MSQKTITRILALDLHPRHFGYGVLENGNRLLDWGVRSSRGRHRHSDVLIRQRLLPLLELWKPSTLVISGPPPRVDRIIQRIAGIKKGFRVRVYIIKHRSEMEHERKFTKYENARLVVERFPVLGWKLPPRRRAWESEDYRMSMLTAVHLVHLRAAS